MLAEHKTKDEVVPPCNCNIDAVPKALPLDRRTLTRISIDQPIAFRSEFDAITLRRPSYQALQTFNVQRPFDETAADPRNRRTATAV
jgi:hypothetical protein